MPILPTVDKPFGFLTPLHEYILDNAEPISLSNAHHVIAIPMAPLAVQCLLIQYPNTRHYRAALAVLGITLIVKGVVSYRFANVVHNAFNDGFGIAALHLIAKYVEFGVIEGPVLDRWVKAGRRSRLLGAFDLAINSRWVGLGPVGVMTKSQERAGPGGNNNAQHDEKAVEEFEQERWLPYVDVGRTRMQATLRHLYHAILHYITIDTLMGLIQVFGTGTIAEPHYTPNSIPTFISTHTFTLFPHLYPISPPPWLVEVVVELSVAAGVWQGISWGYHVFGFLAVGSGLYEVEAWEVDHFDAPWNADSLLDMWGKRWHQMFRHHFLLLSTFILHLFGLPSNHPLVLPLIFFFSGALHALGQLSMSPVPNVLPLIGFFFFSGVGAALEGAFRKVTGRRVRGWAGRTWMWIWLLYTGRMAVGAWLDGGMGGQNLVPSGVWRPGPYIAGFIGEWLVQVKR